MSNKFKEIDDKTLKKLREVQIEILNEIKRICEKNNIKYFLVGGTLLGAIRHKGFIPWDDDLDIGMLREDYEKFQKCCKKDLDKKYFLHSINTDENYWLPFIKIRKNNTLFDEEFIKDFKCKSKGIFIDIFPMDYVSDIRIIAKIKKLFISCITEAIFVKRNLRTIKECRKPIISKFFTIFSCNRLFKMQRKISISKKTTSHIMCYGGAYSFEKEYLPANLVTPLKNVLFEKSEYPAFNDCDLYLTSLYGNYMELPPVEKRVNHCAYVISFDITNEEGD